MSSKQLIVKWLAGLLLGTLIIGLTSPLFVRSYLPQRLDSVRGQYVPVSGLRYRWRSEGYATTYIGRYGMPGRGDVPPKRAGAIRVALWGDSQAEGVCVPDDQKLFAQIQRAAKAQGTPIEVLPLARSGDDASHWLAQIPSVERSLHVDVHLLMIVELGDLKGAVDAGPPPPADNERRLQTQSALAAKVPAFAIDTVRKLVTDPAGNRRKLRFSVGPPDDSSMARAAIPDQQLDRADLWQLTMQKIRAVSDRPIVILYTPHSPHIAGGKIVLHDSQDEQFQDMERAAIKAGLRVVNASDALADSARGGQWPHGFHNGQIGDGHLNAIGYHVIAREVTRALAK